MDEDIAFVMKIHLHMHYYSLYMKLPKSDLNIMKVYNQFINHSSFNRRVSPWDTYLPSRP